MKDLYKTKVKNDMDAVIDSRTQSKTTEKREDIQQQGGIISNI